MPNRIDLDSEKLRRLYLVEKLSRVKIALKLGVSEHCVRNNLKRNNIPLRSRKESAYLRRKHSFEYNEVWELYHKNKKSIREMADIYGVGPTILRYHMKLLGITFRSKEEVYELQSFERHPSWKGGRYMTRGGYVKVKLRKRDPFIDMVDANRYVLEHRYIIAKHLGRSLTRKEIVHHKNGDKIDNRLENLLLLPQKTHNKIGKNMPNYCRGCEVYKNNQKLTALIEELKEKVKLA